MIAGFTRSHGERISPSHWLGRALERRGIAVREIDGPEDGVDVVLVGAPEARLGPELVRTWRTFTEGGGHVLAIWPEDAPDADSGLFLPGLEAVAADPTSLRLGPTAAHRRLALEWPGGRIQTRGPSRLTPPEGPVAGSLRPKGKRWVGFSHTYDVLRAWPIDGGWAFVQLALGAGTVGLVAGTRALADDQPTALRTRLLEAWLPSLHAHVLQSAPPVVLDHAHGARTPDGLVVDEILVPGGPIAAVRALVDGALVERAGERLRLTEQGRANERLVGAVWELERVLASVDAGT